VPSSERREAVLVVAGDCDPEHVRHGLRDHLEDFKIPPKCVVVDGLPANANGKTDKAVLARRVEELTHV
jgi:non-ribosomal peptide synthetase component E (peptide arylation enzyme)